MSDARTEILRRIAAANGRSIASEVPARIAQRLGNPKAGPQLHWPEPDRERFLTRLRAASASVDQVADLATAATAIAEFLAAERVSEPAVVAAHAMLSSLPLANAEQRPLRSTDRVAVTVAFAGVAETGSLALLSRPETPTGFNFLPEFLVCLLPLDRILSSLEDLWVLIRRERGSLPRAVNLVTGPSRTADVEQTIQLGAHGPRRLHAIVVTDPI